MELNGFINIEEIDGAGYTAFQADRKMKQDGKVLISVRVERPPTSSDGSFEEAFHYLIGKPAGK
jgi:hypothetical protein